MTETEQSGMFSDPVRNVTGIALLSGLSGFLAATQGRHYVAYGLAVVAWAAVAWLLVYGDVFDVTGDSDA